jgi:hypothetical protein
MSITRAIDSAYVMKKERGWDKIYFAIDLHGTIIKPGRNIVMEFYEGAKETLQYLSQQKDIVLILYTSTKIPALVPFLSWCDENEVNFKYINENPECANTHDGDYSKKPYFSILADDRSGFDPHVDWVAVKHSFQFNIEKSMA